MRCSLGRLLWSISGHPFILLAWVSRDHFVPAYVQYQYTPLERLRSEMAPPAVGLLAASFIGPSFEFSNQLRSGADGCNRAGRWRQHRNYYDERVHRNPLGFWSDETVLPRIRCHLILVFHPRSHRVQPCLVPLLRDLHGSLERVCHLR